MWCSPKRWNNPPGPARGQNHTVTASSVPPASGSGLRALDLAMFMAGASNFGAQLVAVADPPGGAAGLDGDGDGDGPSGVDRAALEPDRYVPLLLRTRPVTVLG